MIELLSLLVIIYYWCSHAIRNKDIWIVSDLHGNLEPAFPSPFPEFYLILVMYWHIYPLESTQGPLACFFSWNWTSRASIRSVEGDGMARERSIYRFQVFPSFITMFALYQAIQLLNFKCVIICFCWIYRGGGFISLENLLYSKNFQVSKNHLTQVLVHIHLNISAMLAYASLVA